MKLGFLGPANGNEALLREAVEFLVSDVEVDQAIYLGLDDHVDEVVSRWARDIAGDPSDEAFLTRAVELAQQGDAESIDELLSRDASVARLACVRKLPPAPARAIEMIEDRIVTVVYDKRVLTEEDIANATLLVYGKSSEASLKRFGPRYFFTPGPLGAGKIGLVEAEQDGQVAIGLFEPSGAPVWREVLHGRGGSKMMVST